MKTNTTTLLSAQPHRRYNALSGEWVLVSPHRNRRPWQGISEATATESLPVYEPQCYLCPGNTRADGTVNPLYENVFVFVNDFSALLPENKTAAEESSTPLYQTQAVAGECRVVCYAPQHNKTMAQLSHAEIMRVAQAWQQQYNELSARYAWVQIFENHGELMGCSNPHPHGQIWACDYLPNEATKETQTQTQYYQKHRRVLLSDVAAEEIKTQQRIVASNDDWLWLVPFWAQWPFETLLLCRHRIADFSALSESQLASLAAILKTATATYDRVFNCAFPYSMGWHNAPTNNAAAQEAWCLHAHFYPPLLRSATVRKFMVGFELLSEPQRDFTPEQAAQILREARARAE